MGFLGGLTAILSISFFYWFSFPISLENNDPISPDPILPGPYSHYR